MTKYCIEHTNKYEVTAKQLCMAVVLTVDDKWKAQVYIDTASYGRVDLFAEVYDSFHDASLALHKWIAENVEVKEESRRAPLIKKWWSA